MGYSRDDPWMTCGERDDQCAALGIDDPFAEIDRLRKPLTMSDIRLVAGEGKLTAHDVLAAANAVLRGRLS